MMKLNKPPNTKLYIRLSETLIKIRNTAGAKYVDNFSETLFINNFN